MNYEQEYKNALERASKLKVQNPFDTVGQMVEHIFPELKESEDEKMLREIKGYIKEQGDKPTGLPNGTVAVSDMIAWLEKQSEKDPCIGCTNDKGCVTCENSNLKEIKVEPKFHEGDWITDGSLTCKVLSVTGKSYELHLYNDDYCHFGTDVQSVDKHYHLWSINDAKDGDVLVNGSNIFIFHFINDTRLMGYCHVNIDNGRFYDDIGKNECFCLIDAIVIPATKEQRDLFFSKMKEAGYEWDSSNKEVKKIEVANKEGEDEQMIGRLKSCVYASDLTTEGRNELIVWLEKQTNKD